MRIAIDIPAYYPSAWKIAAGALEYATSKEGVKILLPHAPMASAEDIDPRHWDAAVISKPRPDLDLPKVCVSPAHAGDEVSVTINEDEVVKLAVDQFVSMGLGTLAFFGNPSIPISRLRWSGFSQYVENIGISPVFISTIRADDPWGAVIQLRKPCGIMTFNDKSGLRLLALCKEVGLEVPRDVHVISVDDTPACLEVRPTLSGVALPSPLLGFHAARLCEQMVNGASVESVRLPPSGLIIRDSIKVENDDIRTAAAIAHYLRTHLSNPIQMEDVVRRSSMSRRRLEQVFQSAYATSPIAYLRELRIHRAKWMLESSDAPLKEIVSACGYSSSIHLCRMFKKDVGLSPMRYRESCRKDT